MMLVEEMIVPDAALPIDALRRHVRLGTGFAEDDMQEELLASFLRAAMSAIESRTGKALLQRDFRLVLTDWYSADRQPLPLAPVVSVTGIQPVSSRRAGYGGRKRDAGRTVGHMR